MDSDDTNLHKCGLDDDDDLLVSDLDNSIYHSNFSNYDSRKTNNRKNLDNNGNNQIEADENANNLNGGNLHDTDSDLELDNIIKKGKDNNNETVDENTISRIQAMALSDDDDYGE